MTFQKCKRGSNAWKVFALGGRDASDNATESAYWMTRAALSKSVADAATYLTEKGAVDVAAPVITCGW